MADPAGPGRPPAPDVRLAVSARSAVKPRNDSFSGASATHWRANEDRFHIGQGPDGVFMAVADGAGASGLFCGAWAETLVTRLPDRPIVDLPGLDSWLAGFALNFREDYGRRAAADPAKRAKFVREGSCATLAACWLGQATAPLSLTWLAYGDSPVMVFDLTGGRPRLVACHPDRLAAFGRDPHLLNWRDLPNADGLRVGRVDLPVKAAVVVASDAVGLFLLFRHLAGGSGGPGNSGVEEALAEEFRRLAASDGRLSAAAQGHSAAAGEANVIEELRRYLGSQADFSAMISRFCENGLLANDDATVVMIEVEVLPPPVDAPPEQGDEAVAEQPSDDGGAKCHCRPTENPGS